MATFATVDEWLNSLKLEKYIENFTSNGFDDMDVVATMTPDDLDAIGVTLAGHKKKIVLSLQKLNESRPAAPAPAPAATPAPTPAPVEVSAPAPVVEEPVAVAMPAPVEAAPTPAVVEEPIPAVDEPAAEIEIAEEAPAPVVVARPTPAAKADRPLSLSDVLAGFDAPAADEPPPVEDEEEEVANVPEVNTKIDALLDDLMGELD
eukprot:Opistho-2@87832